MTDSAGSDVNRYVYDPYGTIISQQEQSGFFNLFKFAGGQYRSSTGLYKFGTRYYDSSSVPLRNSTREVRAFSIGRAVWREETFPGEFNSSLEQGSLAPALRREGSI